MQNIAMENNLAETSFYIKDGEKYQIRWFTPVAEVDLCGHATLATAFVLFNLEGHVGDVIEFYSPRSGKLIVTKKDDLLTMNFPTDVFERVEMRKELTDGFNIEPREAYKGKTDYMLVFDNESQIKNMIPDITSISKLNARGVIVTAKGDSVDFVSRFFAPQVGVETG
jgi:PhzF family phenazine biosynthesis protein